MPITANRGRLRHIDDADGSHATIETEQFMIVVSHLGEIWKNAPALSPVDEFMHPPLRRRVHELRMHRLSTLRKDLRRFDNGALWPRWNHDRRCVCHDRDFIRLWKSDPVKARDDLTRLIERVDSCPPVFDSMYRGEVPYLHLPYIKPIPLGSPVRSWTIHNPT